ncbi:hypothetical protein CH352_07050 [Leptospira hartskeerlii]|uniref:Uncharacterized protein n=1 Tax=Leptospira hartskeerlii TaxID=2023177 RepID=A0A2M9XFE5_9LEPT|nr:hypothetical protein [Leptospira hartskeerlii]PJZ26322.1 hypothetical protein CH357_07455 [Leptospira hartskeerlii]PJZ34407.1 hypothetical protein CH352_07050 [Leptospira hartskeerlii]
MVTLKNFLPKLYSLLLIVFALNTMGCYSRPKKSGLLDYMNISNIVSYLGGTASEINVQVNGLTNSGILIVELVSTGEQITFNAGAGTLTDTFSGVYDYNQTYTLNIFSQPATSPTQTCIISNPNLNLNFYNKTFVVNCAENWYKANVSVTGIDSTNTTNLQIYNNGTDLKTRTSNGTVSFDVGDGLAYDITIGTVPTVPSTHTCQVVTSPANGTISGADVNLQISCLSLMKTSVAAGGFMPSTKAMTFTFSGPVTGCILDSTGGGPPYSAGTANGSPGVTYIGNGARIAPTTLPWSFGALTFPQQVNFTLTGCSDAVASANNGAALSVTIKMMEGDVYFVRYAAGDDSNSCLDPSDACLTIQAAVNKCSSSFICNIFVEGGVFLSGDGIYKITSSVSPITLTSSGGIRLLGSFDSTFNTQSLDATPSTIVDARPNSGGGSCAGSVGLGTDECAPITITAAGMGNDPNKAHVVQGFSIVADITKKFAFGIRIVNGNSDSYSYIIGNYISGGNTSGNSATGGVRGGIYLNSSNSTNVIDTNVIKGGYNVDGSYGVVTFSANAYLYRNRISGDKTNLSTGTSAAVNITSYNDPVIAILNNTMNYRQYSDSSDVTSFFSYGINSYENTATTKYHIAGNTIYSSGGINSNTGINMYGVSTKAQMLNNLVHIPSGSASPTCAHFTNTPTTSSVFQGNDLDCSTGTKVISSGTSFNVYCTSGAFSTSALCSLTTTFLNDIIVNTRGVQNFTNTPIFAAYPALQPWLALGLATGSGGSCNIVYGGVNTFSSLGSFDSEYLLDATIVSPVTRVGGESQTPPGSYGYSIGAFEVDDTSCVP